MSSRPFDYFSVCDSRSTGGLEGYAWESYGLPQDSRHSLSCGPQRMVQRSISYISTLLKHFFSWPFRLEQWTMQVLQREKALERCAKGKERRGRRRKTPGANRTKTAGKYKSMNVFANVFLFIYCCSLFHWPFSSNLLITPAVNPLVAPRWRSCDARRKKRKKKRPMIRISKTIRTMMKPPLLLLQLAVETRSTRHDELIHDVWCIGMNTLWIVLPLAQRHCNVFSGATLERLTFVD